MESLGVNRVNDVRNEREAISKFMIIKAIKTHKMTRSVTPAVGIRGLFIEILKSHKGTIHFMGSQVQNDNQTNANKSN